jgi:hypothetical protein
MTWLVRPLVIPNLVQDLGFDPDHIISMEGQSSNFPLEKGSR